MFKELGVALTNALAHLKHISGLARQLAFVVVAHDIVFWGKEHRQEFIQKPEARGPRDSRSSTWVAFHLCEQRGTSCGCAGEGGLDTAGAEGQLCPSSPFALSLGWGSAVESKWKDNLDFWTQWVSSGIALKWRIYSLKSS